MSVAIVVLAAGEASRFGSPKQLADWFGQPLLTYVIKKLSTLNEPLFVCLGANQGKIESTIDINPACIINVKNWKLGPGASIKTSLSVLNKYSVEDDVLLKGVLFVTGDQPLLEIEHYENILTQAKQTGFGDIIATEYPASSLKMSDESQGGVPVFFPKKVFDDLCKIANDKGAQSLIAKHCSITIPVMGSVMDIDTPEDLMRARIVAEGM